MNSYISLDLEMTGLNPKYDRIIEIGAVKVINGEVVENFSEFVNPGRKLSDDVRKLTGISEENLLNAETAGTVIPRLIDFCEDYPLVGHRIISDFSFVKKEAVNIKLSFEKEAVDTLRLSRACLPELPSKKLTDMCAYYNIEYEAHRALNDAEATYKLFEKLKENFYQKYPDSFVPRKLNFQIKKESPARQSQIDRIRDLVTRNKVDCPYDLTLMSRNEASRYYDILISEYGK